MKKKSKQRIIGICGFKGSGKDTLANIILQHDHNFVRDSFAGPVKDGTAMLFGWPRKMLEGDTSMSRRWRELPDPYWSTVFGRDFCPREALQLFGTESVRNVFHTDFWVQSLLRRIKTYDYDVVVSDVRFKNEVDAIRKVDGDVIVVIRGPLPEWYDLALAANNYGNFGSLSQQKKAQKELKRLGIHASETSWIGAGPYSLEIANNGTKKDMERKFVTWWEERIT